MTFIRTGDVDIDSLPDPANLAPRVVSPAEAFMAATTRSEPSRTARNNSRRTSSSQPTACGPATGA